MEEKKTSVLIATIKMYFIPVVCNLLIFVGKPRQYTADSQTSGILGVGNNDSLRIFTRILLYPKSEFVQWNFTRKVNESKIISNNSRGYTIKILRGEAEENITLYKENVATDDFGNYTVIVGNEVGVFEKKYQVRSASKRSF